MMLYHLLFGRERTTSVTVHERPDPTRDRISRAEDLVFIKDGFDWGAFLLPPAYFLQHQIWAGLAAYMAWLVALAVIHLLFGAPLNLMIIALIAGNVFIGWEADEIKRASIDGQGWTMIGQVTGTSLLDCERRFLDGWLASVPLSSATRPNPAAGSHTGGTAAADQLRSQGQTGRTGRTSVLGNMFAPRSRH